MCVSKNKQNTHMEGMLIKSQNLVWKTPDPQRNLCAGVAEALCEPCRPLRVWPTFPLLSVDPPARSSVRAGMFLLRSRICHLKCHMPLGPPVESDESFTLLACELRTESIPVLLKSCLTSMALLDSNSKPAN